MAATPDVTATGTQYVQHTMAGAEYLRYITSSEPDRRARSAFQDLALRIAPPGAALFDFGAGAGIDARFFAERGLTIRAYDVDPRMREFFQEYCRDLMQSGRIALDTRSYPEFVSCQSPGTEGRFDLIVANFAPLNLIDDLRGLFATFHGLAAADGKILASVLNPCFIRAMRSRSWWRRAPQLWRDGHIFMPGPQAPHHLRRLANFRELSTPYFRLTRVFRGLPLHGQVQSKGVHAARGSLRAFLHVATCPYMFLLFEKRH
jgi:SAM-dependent methyltransferase